MNKADELRQIAEANEADGLDAIANGLRISAAAMDQMAEALRKIERRATPHPDDTPEDIKRNLYHVLATAERALSAYEGKDNG